MKKEQIKEQFKKREMTLKEQIKIARIKKRHWDRRVQECEKEIERKKKELDLLGQELEISKAQYRGSIIRLENLEGVMVMIKAFKTMFK